MAHSFVFARVILHAEALTAQREKEIRLNFR